LKFPKTVFYSATSAAPEAAILLLVAGFFRFGVLVGFVGHSAFLYFNLDAIFQRPKVRG